MANTFSALKRARQTKRRTAVNRARKSRLRHQMRNFWRQLEDKKLEAAQAMMPDTFSVIDQAAKLGIIKKNTAARYKSRLHFRLKALAGA